MTEANGAPALVDAEPRTTAVVHGQVPLAEIRDFFDTSFQALAGALSEQGVSVVGPAFGRYHGPPGEIVDLEVGFPVDRVVERAGAVVPGELPGGRVARLVHAGGFEGLGAAWGRLGEWMRAEGLAAGRDLWEVYLTEPTPEMDPADLRTELNWAVLR